MYQRGILIPDTLTQTHTDEVFFFYQLDVTLFSLPHHTIDSVLFVDTLNYGLLMKKSNTDYLFYSFLFHICAGARFCFRMFCDAQIFTFRIWVKNKATQVVFTFTNFANEYHFKMNEWYGFIVIGCGLCIQNYSDLEHKFSVIFDLAGSIIQQICNKLGGSS